MIDPIRFQLHTKACAVSEYGIMIDRIIPIFAVIGVLSSILYLILAVWIIYKQLKRKYQRHKPR